MEVSRTYPLQSAAATNALKPITESKGAAEIAGSFGEMLEKSLNNLEQLDRTVNALNQKFAAGQNVDVHTLMIASERAQLGLQLTVQVRNKVIEAYQEIMRTQL